MARSKTTATSAGFMACPSFLELELASMRGRRPRALAVRPPQVVSIAGLCAECRDATPHLSERCGTEEARVSRRHGDGTRASPGVTRPGAVLQILQAHGNGWNGYGVSRARGEGDNGCADRGRWASAKGSEGRWRDPNPNLLGGGRRALNVHAVVAAHRPTPADGCVRRGDVELDGHGVR